MNRSQITRLLTNISLAAIFLAGFLPLMPNLSHDVGVGIAAIFMSVAGVATVWKQKLSVEIDNKIIIPTILFSLAGLLGGVADYFDAIKDMDQDTKLMIRWGILAAIGLINTSSKSWFPTYEAKQIEHVKEEIAQNE